MAIRLWPQDYERKDHITKAEKGILRYAARNFQNGHMVVGIDPVGLSGERVKLGMYISPSEGLVTFSIYSGMINAMPVFSYIAYVQMVEGKIYERLLDSKLLIVRNGEKKALKFPYKHIVMFPDEVVGKTTVSKDDLQQLRNYATFDSFRPITSDGKEKRIEYKEWGREEFKTYLTELLAAKESFQYNTWNTALLRALIENIDIVVSEE